MEEIILSGYSVKEFKKVINKGKKPGCYFCKRKPGEKSVYTARDAVGESMGTEKLGFGVFEIAKAGRKFLYPVCNECLLIMAHLEDSHNHARLFESLSLN